MLVLEVLSPSTRRIDLATKRMAYADAGVAAYGLVDPGVPLAHRARARSRRVQAVATVVGDEAWSETPIRAVITPSRLVD